MLLFPKVHDSLSTAVAVPKQVPTLLAVDPVEVSFEAYITKSLGVTPKPCAQVNAPVVPAA